MRSKYLTATVTATGAHDHALLHAKRRSQFAPERSAQTAMCSFPGFLNRTWVGVRVVIQHLFNGKVGLPPRRHQPVWQVSICFAITAPFPSSPRPQVPRSINGAFGHSLNGVIKMQTTGPKAYWAVHFQVRTSGIIEYPSPVTPGGSVDFGPISHSTHSRPNHQASSALPEP